MLSKDHQLKGEALTYSTYQSLRLWTCYTATAESVENHLFFSESIYSKSKSSLFELSSKLKLFAVFLKNIPASPLLNSNGIFNINPSYAWTLLSTLIWKKKITLFKNLLSFTQTHALNFFQNLMKNVTTQPYHFYSLFH